MSVRDDRAMIRHNRPLVLLCASTLLFLTGMFSVQTVAVFYARDVLGNADLYIVMTAVQTVAHGRCGRASSRRRSTTIGKKRAYIARRSDRRGRRLGFALAPGSMPAIGIACYGVLGIGFGAINALIFALQADTVEYGEWKSGVRAEGASYAVLSFTRKAGQGDRRRGGRLHDRPRRLRLGRGEPDATPRSPRSGSPPASCRRSPSRPRQRSCSPIR